MFMIEGRCLGGPWLSDSPELLPLLSMTVAKCPSALFVLIAFIRFVMLSCVLVRMTVTKVKKFV